MNIAKEKSTNISFGDAAKALALQRLIQRVHGLGARVVYELVAEISRSLQPGEAIFDIVEKYAERLTPEMLRVTGGDRFPPAPLRRVP
jgi:hypothetical protein